VPIEPIDHTHSFLFPLAEVLMRRCFSFRHIVAGFALLGVTSVALAATWTSTDKFGTWANGGFTVANDVWGSGAGAQSIWANSFSNWGIWTQQPNTNGVKSYAHVEKNINIKTNSLKSATSSFKVSLPGGTNIYNVSYDIWTPSEVMIWMYHTSGDRPIAKGYNSSGSIPSYTNVSVGGSTWDVYIGGSPTVVSFVRTSNETSGSVDIREVLQYATSKGWIANNTIKTIQFGFEVVSTNNVGENFECDSYSLSDN
jgi:hypothetical protein